MSQNVEHGFDPPEESGVFTARGGSMLRRLAWTAGVVGQLMGVMVQAAAPLYGLARSQRSERWPRGKSNTLRPTSHADLLLSQLKKSVLGRSKKQIAADMGPPAAAILHPTAISGSHPVFTPTSDYFQTDTWYYRFSTQDHSAIAIVFRSGYARRVEYIEIPL